uniref:Uncharacterized protein n=1 Tax=viral metagenome TaxID=1070528 RepID=A0A6M3JXI1_9ZZZZ
MTEVDLTQVQCTNCGNLDQETTFCSHNQQYVPKNEQEMVMERLCWIPIPPDETPVEDVAGSENDTIIMPDTDTTPPAPPPSNGGDTIIECPNSVAITIILPHEDYEVISFYCRRSKK